MELISDWIVNSASSLGAGIYVVVALVCLLESLPFIGFFTPGIVVLLAGGFLASVGLISLAEAWLYSAVGAIIGDIFAFQYGRRFKSWFRSDNRLFKIKYLRQAEKFFDKFGNSSMFFGRFFGPVRPMVNMVAGAARITFLRFIIFSVIGAISFCGLYLGLGYTAGSAWQTVEQWSSRAALLVLCSIAAILLLWWIKWVLVKQGESLGEVLAEGSRAFYKYLKTRTWFKRFSSTSPRLARIISRRLNPMMWAGLPLTTLTLALCVCLILFYNLGSAAVGSEFINQLDNRIHNGMALFRQPGLGQAAVWLTVFGSVALISTFVVGATLWFLARKKRSYIMGLLVTVFGSLGGSWVAKMIFERERPEPTFFFESFYSYPSSHATLVFAFFMFLSYYVSREHGRWSRKLNALFLASVIVLTVSVSRLYLGVHYFSDIIGAWLLASVFLIIGVIIQHWLAHIDGREQLSRLRKTSLAAALIPLCLIIYLSVVSAYEPIDTTYRPIIRQEDATIRLNGAFNRLPRETENLRGGRKRPISFIFIVPNERRLREDFSAAGWTILDKPSLSSFLAKARSTLFKQDYAASPIRPRFWRNEPNVLAFMKPLGDQKRENMYQLRVWRAPVDAGEGLETYFAEISLNRDLEFSLDVETFDLKAAKVQVLNDLSQTEFLQGFDTIKINDADTDHEEAAETIFIFKVR